MGIRIEGSDVQTDNTVQPALSLIQTPAEEAAKNIDLSRLFDIHPDSYANLKEHLGPNAEAIDRIPATVEPVTKDFVAQSEQHAALAKEDLGIMNTVEKHFRYFKQQTVDLPDLNNQIIDLANKKITDGKLAPEEEEQLKDLNLAVDEINKSNEGNKTIGTSEKVAVDVASGVKQFVQSYWDNKGIILGTTGGGAALGAAAGSFIPGIGTAAGGTAGAIQGFEAGATIVGFMDGYSKTRGMVFNELSRATDKDGQPLNIPQDRMVKVSQGVALIAGIAQGVAGKVIASKNPIAQRFVSPQMAAQLLKSSAATMAKMEILGGVVQSAAAQGGAGALSEVAKIVGENFAKMDESEASFMNALNTALESDNLKKIAQAGATSAATGAVISGTMGVIGRKGLENRFQEAKNWEQFKVAREANWKAQAEKFWSENPPAQETPLLPGMTNEQLAKYDEVQNTANKRSEVLQSQNNILEVANQLKETKMNKLAPQEMNTFTKKVFSAIGMGDDFWYTMEGLREFSNSPEKGAAVRKVVDPTGQLTQMAQQLNVPIPLAKSDVLQIATEFPEITDHMKLSPDGESPVEARTKSEDFVNRLKAAGDKRKEILSSLGADQPLSPELQQQLDNLSAEVQDPNVYNGQTDYLDTQSFNEIPGILSKEEADSFNLTHMNAKLEVAKSLRAEVDRQYNTVENSLFRDMNAEDIQNDIVQLDKEYSIINRFTEPTDNSEAFMAATKNHAKKGFSPSAIDPRSLPEDLKAIYFDENGKLANNALKQRKVFVKGGMDIEEAAAFNGVGSGEELLHVLANTPSKTELKTNRAQREIELKNRIHQTINPIRTEERDNAFSNMTRVHIKEMEHLRTKEWPTVKRGIIKITTKAPTVEELNSQAKDMISKMVIRDMNPNAFKVGEQVSQREATKNFLNAEFEQAFENKRKAALNNELRKESLNAQDKVKKYQTFWKKVTNATNQQELKDAGYLNAMNDFMSIYKLDGTVKSENEKNSFANWVKKQVDAGEYVPYIPERLDSTQASFKDLTVEQYQAITEAGQTILQQAKLKNKLMKEITNRKDLRTQEQIAATVEEALVEHFKYDPKKAEKKSNDYLTMSERWHNKLQTSLSTVSSIKTLAFELDERKPGGLFNDLIANPLKEARTAKREEMYNIVNNDIAMVEHFYGMDNFKKMFNEFRYIPEFSNIATLGDGEGYIRKVDLLTLQAYMGDPDGREAMKNFITRDGIPLNVEDVSGVLERELDGKDAQFVQNFLVNRFKQFEQRSYDLHLKTTGNEPDMVKGVPVQHKGKEYPGGYFPIKRQMLPDEIKASKWFEKLKDLDTPKETEFFAQMRASEMTRQGRLKDRTGSLRPLDIKFENFISSTEEAVHDLHFREVGIDTLKILKNPQNVKNMKAVLGQKKFASLLNAVKDSVSKTTERESSLFGDEQQMFNSAIQNIHSLHAVKTIGLNLTSVAIQPSSLTNVMMNLGPQFNVYLGKQIASTVANLSHFPDRMELAKQINPDLKYEQDGIDAAIVKDSYDFIPATNAFFKDYKTLSAQSISRLREVQKKAVDASMHLVREADHVIKMVVTLAASEQFLNGEVEGFPLEKVQGMSESERATQMRKIVQQAVDLSLTASSPEDKTPLEKNKIASIFARYWTDRRSRLNTIISMVDKIKGSYRKGNNSQAVKHFMTLLLATGVCAALEDMIRGNKNSIIKNAPKLRKSGAEELGFKWDDKTSEDVKQFALDQSINFLIAPIEQTLETIPLVDNIKYQVVFGGNARSDYRNVSTPLFNVASDVATGVAALNDALGMALKGKHAKISDVQRKALLADAGYIVGGAPTNALNKALDTMQSGTVRKGGEAIRQQIEDLHKNINSFVEMFKDDKEAETFIDDLKQYQKSLPQYDNDVKNIIPQNVPQTIAQIESENKWNTIDPKTGAAGIYQFTAERWNHIANLNPNLGLTENGRVAKSPEQQNKAMNWEIQDNTRGLMTYDIPVSTENLFGAHKFGFDNFEKIFHAEDDKKLSEVLKDESKNPVFDKFTTVKSVKDYLNREVKKITPEVEQ